MSLRRLVTIMISVGWLCVPVWLWAQTPVPVFPSNMAPVMVTDSQEAVISPDDTPPSGGLVLGIGSGGARHSFLQPSLRLVGTLDSNPLLQRSDDGAYRGLADLGGNVRWVQYFGQRAELHYSGALRYDTRARLQGSSQLTSTHSLAFTDQAHWNRWTVLFGDAAHYSQGSAFGASGMEGMGLADDAETLSPFGATPMQMRPDILPNQSIQLGRIGAVSNTALIELDRHPGARNIFTVEASYSVLHFQSNQLTDGEQTSAIAGFNRWLNARDSIAIEGAFTRLDFQIPNTHINAEYFSVLFARRITGRSSIELAAGPELSQAHILGVDSSDVGWQGRATARYLTNRIGLRASAARSITGGAGTLNGARTDSGQGNFDFAVSRWMSLAVTGGASRNQQLTGTQKYDTQFAGIVCTRRMGRYSNLFLSYDLQHQTSGSSVCTGIACGFTGIRHVFGLGYSWTYRPIGID